MKQFRKRMLANGLAMALVITSLVSTQVSASEKGANIKDIKGHWAESVIKDFVNKGHIDGYGDDTFRPDNKITRAEFIKIINRAFGFTKKGTEDFKDVSQNDWFYDEVLKAVEQGYIDGDGNGSFRPNDYISREEACKIVGVILKVNGYGDTQFKDDAEISDWASKYVKGLVDMGIIQGFGDDTFRPKANTTRAESVKTIHGAEGKQNTGGGSGGGTIQTITVKDVSIALKGDNVNIKATSKNYGSNKAKVELFKDGNIIETEDEIVITDGSINHTFKLGESGLYTAKVTVGSVSGISNELNINLESEDVQGGILEEGILELESMLESISSDLELEKAMQSLETIEEAINVFKKQFPDNAEIKGYEDRISKAKEKIKEKIATVSNLEGLENALENENVISIILTDKIIINKDYNKGILDGNGKTVKLESDNSDTAIEIYEDDFTLENINVEGDKYAIKVYDATNVKLNNITAKNTTKGMYPSIQVNASEVEVSDINIINNNKLTYGIKVEIGNFNEEQKTSKLNVSGTINMQGGNDKNAIFVENNDDSRGLREITFSTLDLENGYDTKIIKTALGITGGTAYIKY